MGLEIVEFIFMFKYSFQVVKMNDTNSHDLGDPIREWFGSGMSIIIQKLGVR